jgi:hypothetical protein
MAIKAHEPPAVSKVRGRNRAGLNKVLSAPPRDERARGSAKGVGRVGQRTKAAAEAEHARLAVVLDALDAAAVLPVAADSTNGAIITAARDTLARSARQIAGLYLEAIKQLFASGQFASAAIHAAKALELMEARDETGNIERVITRAVRPSERPAPPTINVGIALGGTRPADVAGVQGIGPIAGYQHQQPRAAIDITQQRS